MKHVTAALCVLDAIAACVLVRSASISHTNGSTAYTALFCTTAVILGLGIVHHTVMRDELRAALLRLERASRPPGPTEQQIAAEVAEGHRQLEAICCLAAWDSAGAVHDPTTCTRKDQTT